MAESWVYEYAKWGVDLQLVGLRHGATQGTFWGF